MEWYQGWDQEYRTQYTPVLDLSRNPKCGSTLYSIWNCWFQVVIYSRFRTHLYISVNAYYTSQYTLVANLEQQCWIYARHIWLGHSAAHSATCSWAATQSCSGAGGDRSSMLSIRSLMRSTMLSNCYRIASRAPHTLYWPPQTDAN